MNWDINNDLPIHMQLVDILTQAIVSSYYKPGDKIDSVRDLADIARVNPNTMQKALSELEDLNLLYTKRTVGRYVTEDLDLIKKYRDHMATENISIFLSKMKKLGFDKKAVIDKILKEVK